MRLWRSSTGSPPAVRRVPQSGAENGRNPDNGGWSVRRRLLLIVTIALLPIAAVSILQGVDRARSDEVRVRERLVQTARIASSSEENLLASSEQILLAVANLPAVRNAQPGCSRNLSDARRGIAYLTDIARSDATGKIICSAVHGVTGRSIAGLSVWRAVAGGQPGFAVSTPLANPAGKGRVLMGVLPLHDAQGRFAGALTAAIDVHWLDFMLYASRLPPNSVVAILDRNGAVVASDRPEAAAIFAGADLRNTDAQMLRHGSDSSGNSWTYVTSPLVGKSIFVGFAMRKTSLFGSTYVHVATDFILPFLMIALTWIAIWAVTQREITQWIEYLQRLAAAYRTGHYNIRPELDGAPSDFKVLGGALSEMAEAIQQRDSRLREALVQKTLLIKEIHHRVKNNLQIVISLLSLQANRLRDPAAQDALRQSRTRINALALVHRLLYEIEDQNNVDIKRLLEDLVQQTYEGFGGARRDVRVRCEVRPLIAHGDVAVPLALFTVEALTNVFKHAFPPGHGGTIVVRLEPLNARSLRLAIEDDGEGFSYAETDASVGARLMKTFGHQVNGVAMLRSAPHEGTVAEIVFPMPEEEVRGLSGIGANDDGASPTRPPRTASVR